MATPRAGDDHGVEGGEMSDIRRYVEVWDKTSGSHQVVRDIEGINPIHPRYVLADDYDDLQAQVAGLEATIRQQSERYQAQLAEEERLEQDRDTLRAENARLKALINTPQIENFLEAVRVEAAHQCERWGVDHDAGKTDADWLWLVGYLAGKALHKPEKRLHHIITTAAACLNWHRNALAASSDPKETP